MIGHGIYDLHMLYSYIFEVLVENKLIVSIRRKGVDSLFSLMWAVHILWSSSLLTWTSHLQCSRILEDPRPRREEDRVVREVEVPRRDKRKRRGSFSSIQPRGSFSSRGHKRAAAHHPRPRQVAPKRGSFSSRGPGVAMVTIPGVIAIWFGINGGNHQNKK